MRVRGLFVIIAVLTVAALGVASAQSWNAFSTATITGVTVTPFFAEGTTHYTFALQPGATVNGMAVTQILGVFAVGDPQAATFAATGTGVPGWSFASSTATGYVAGWSSLGNPNRINPGESKAFDYTTFGSFAGGGVLPGWHLAYVANPATGAVTTSFFKDAGTPVIPEPSTVMLALLGGGASGLLGLVRRRRA